MVSRKKKQFCLDVECIFNQATICKSKHYKLCGSSLKYTNLKSPQHSIYREIEREREYTPNGDRTMKLEEKLEVIDRAMAEVMLKLAKFIKEILENEVSFEKPT